MVKKKKDLKDPRFPEWHQRNAPDPEPPEPGSNE